MSSPIDGFVWYELVTANPQRALDFYGHVVGWTWQKFPGPGAPYHVLEAGGKGMGGVFEMTPEMARGGMQAGWVGYLHSADVDARAEQLKRAGGEVYRAPADIPGVGRFVPVADPQGAGFILFKPTPPPGKVPDFPTGVGTVAWHELRTNDINAAFAFYSELFGWQRSTAVDMGPEMGLYQLFRTGKDDVGGMMKNLPNVPSNWLYYFMVDSVAAAEKRVKAKGGTVLFGPSEVPGGGWIIQGRDPEGVQFALTGPR